ncbi:hypothetical protein WICPIJ_004637 [Wickerhamomyces pijperi]|uniref:Sugar phosphate transporter domain-containing protein n=1 Tax=Wickerhamomyces pijperi TaxID=599730 RepID=A0A9P8Q544_WICPI|nr:hypothetical protein WICPIJ_004637 [Wickerhamomyces pijperi]
MSNIIFSLIPPISLEIILSCLLWYSVSSASSQVTKLILNDFPYPLALGEIQFIIVSVLSILTVFLFKLFPYLHSLFPKGTIPPKEQSIRDTLVPTMHILMTVLPLGCFQFLGKWFSHSATALVPVSTVAGVKTLSPFVLVLTYRLLYKVKFPTATYLTLAPLILGILMIVVADKKGTLERVQSEAQTLTNDSILCAHNIGILYAALSLLVFVSQNIYGKTVFTYNQKHFNDHQELALGKSSSEIVLPIYNDLSEKEIEQRKAARNYEAQVAQAQKSTRPMTTAGRKKYDKLTLLLFCSIVGSLLSLPWFLIYEYPIISTAVSAIPETIEEGNNSITVSTLVIPWHLLMINGMSHFCQSMIAFHLLGAMATVSYSVASMMKRITIIVVSIAYTGKSITGLQFMGIFLTAIGLYSYDRWGGHA